MITIVKYVVAIAAFLIVGAAYADDVGKINAKKWIHGSQNCKTNDDPPIDILKYDSDSYILRQNKCLNFEAPFIYVLFGEHTVFVQDTGATKSAKRFPLYKTIKSLIAKRQKSAGEDYKILVTHSHSHGDHKAGDRQFKGKPNVTLVKPKEKAVREYFGFGDWPEGAATIDLGGRILTVLPLPGHQGESLAVYDPQTKWLLTGDSFYPGWLIVKDWAEYQASIQRLVNFTATHPVSALLGTHIEMSKATGGAYEYGSTYQPDEVTLALLPEDLRDLNKALIEIGSEPKNQVLEKFVISPLNVLEKFLSNVLS